MKKILSVLLSLSLLAISSPALASHAAAKSDAHRAGAIPSIVKEKPASRPKLAQAENRMAVKRAEERLAKQAEKQALRTKEMQQETKAGNDGKI